MSLASNIRPDFAAVGPFASLVAAIRRAFGFGNSTIGRAAANKPERLSKIGLTRYWPTITTPQSAQYDLINGYETMAARYDARGDEPMARQCRSCAALLRQAISAPRA